MIEFFFLLLTLVIETRGFYIKELTLREKFMSFHSAVLPVANKFENPSLKTDIEEITRSVKEAIQMVPQLIGPEAKKKVYIEKIFASLSKVLSLLGSRNSVYSVDFSDLEKNLDDEDKIFLEETCIQKRKTAQHVSLKYAVRKTIEVLKNYELQELQGILKRIGKDWNFNVFFLSECTATKPLQTVGIFCQQKYHLDSVLHINPVVLQDYFAALEALYKPNPYHNSSHAADVLCSFLYIVNQTPLKDHLQDHEMFAIILAMLGHDVAHPGFNNRFLINSRNSLAITCIFYVDNDASVLEHMHSATTFELMTKPGLNLLGSLSFDSYSQIRSLVIGLILATDMAKHFDLIGKFRARFINSDTLPLHDEETRAEVLKIITKASDVGHAAKSEELHMRWTEGIVSEFFAQGDKEKEIGIPISMYCDREKTDVAKSQAGFIKNIVLPIYEAVEMGFDSMNFKEECLDQLAVNLKMWEGNATRKRHSTIGPGEETQTLKGRTETTVAGRTGRSSWATLIINN
jgi:hypothetical protein